MNIDNGELRLFYADQIKEGFTDIPAELQGEAMKALGGERNAVVDLKGDSALAHWAKQERRRRDKSKRSKMAKISRRRNRR